MKTIQSLIFFVTALSLAAQDIPEKEITTEISSVTVFFESAQVTRSKSISLEAGKTTLKFKNLSPFIEARSIQAKVQGPVNVLAVNHQQNFLEALKKPDELVNLESKLNNILEKIRLEETYLAIISEEILFLQSNRVIGGKSQEVSVASLREAYDFYGEKLTLLKMKEIERRKTISELREMSAKISEQISTITTKKEYASGEILITVKSEQKTSIKIDLSYVVRNAGWYPSYDIKAISVNKPLQIVYKANVHQDTKSDWKDVRISFSSGNPDISGVAPEISPYFLNYGTVPPSYHANISQVEGLVYDSDGNPLPGAVIQVSGTTIGTNTDVNGRYSISIPPNAGSLKYSFIGFKDRELPVRSSNINVSMEEDVMALNEVVVTAYGRNATKSMELDSRSLQGKTAGAVLRGTSSPAEMNRAADSSIPVPVLQLENQTTVEFEISMPYTLMSDSKSYAVEMAEFEVPAYYEYYCVPKIEKDAFLIANISDWEKYKLLEGEANLFFEGTYTGKSVLDVRFIKDTLSLSLGRDKNVSVTREKIKDVKTKQFIGTKQEDIRAWEIAVRNNRDQQINMLVIDQVPVPMNTEIELEISDKSGAEYNDKNGEIKWSFKLNPKDRKDLKLKYSVKYPKNKILVIE
ncbi:MAG: DUF4139 domain-containing protein [Marinilabiliaceae bacterium]|nr:DUF4139 domain-containing protein [Marinilabiliaceae bacterium]